MPSTDERSTCGYRYTGPTGVEWVCIASPHGPETWPMPPEVMGLALAARARDEEERARVHAVWGSHHYVAKERAR